MFIYTSDVLIIILSSILKSILYFWDKILCTILQMNVLHIGHPSMSLNLPNFGKNCLTLGIGKNSKVSVQKLVCQLKSSRFANLEHKTDILHSVCTFKK